MMRERHEAAVLAGLMLLLVWYVSLPCDGIMFDALHGDAQTASDHGPQVLSCEDAGIYCHFGAANIMEEMAEIVVYLVVPSVIICKMFMAMRNELWSNVGY
ncbi:MAG: hypothetical protein KGI33_09100 [Thaumarchaeota archaeon]|nr:hypothetical protein [Nitrososphaerota archaeon]